MKYSGFGSASRNNLIAITVAFPLGEMVQLSRMAAFSGMADFSTYTIAPSFITSNEKYDEYKAECPGSHKYSGFSVQGTLHEGNHSLGCGRGMMICSLSMSLFHSMGERWQIDCLFHFEFFQASSRFSELEIEWIGSVRDMPGYHDKMA